jgi:hypothetical protein
MAAAKNTVHSIVLEESSILHLGCARNQPSALIVGRRLHQKTLKSN